VGPRAGLNTAEKRKISWSCRESKPGRPDRSPSLYHVYIYIVVHINRVPGVSHLCSIVAGSFENGNEHCVFIKHQKFLNCLKDYHIPHKSSSPRSYVFVVQTACNVHLSYERKILTNFGTSCELGGLVLQLNSIRDCTVHIESVYPTSGCQLISITHDTLERIFDINMDSVYWHAYITYFLGNIFLHSCFRLLRLERSVAMNIFFFYLVCETIGTAATPGLLCQPRVIV
jgi:hypothetical protein